jgi:ribosomal protein L23
MSTLSLIPHISEKAYAASLGGTYIFNVPTSANKAEVIRAIQSKYGVTVTEANLLVRKGKKARQMRLGGSRGRLPLGTRPNKKLAYITLKQGDVIQIEAFQEVQEQQAAAAPKSDSNSKSKSKSKESAKLKSAKSPTKKEAKK